MAGVEAGAENVEVVSAQEDQLVGEVVVLEIDSDRDQNLVPEDHNNLAEVVEDRTLGLDQRRQVVEGSRDRIDLEAEEDNILGMAVEGDSLVEETATRLCLRAGLEELEEDQVWMSSGQSS